MYIKIKLETFLEILYFINDWLRLMGYGGEFYKLSRLVKSLAEQGVFSKVETEKFYYVKRVLEEFNRVNRMERNK